MKVSIVCPTYNSAATLEQVFACVIAQTHKPYEIIFSDDGSADATVSMLHAFKFALENQGILVRILENNHAGPGAARNRGIASATGEWVAFLDSDDYWTKDKLEKIAAAAMRNPTLNFITHWESFKRLDGQEVLLQQADAIYGEASLTKALYKQCLFSTSAVVCKKEILDQVGGFDVTFPSAQDYELWLRLSPFLKPHVIQEVLGFYIEMPNSITARPYYRRIYPQLRILWRHRNKGGWGWFFYRLTRVILSRQWLLEIKKLWPANYANA